MPVVGHACVGLATAMCTGPRGRSLGVVFWTPVLVGLAYLPDITAQVFDTLSVGALFGVARASVITHSVTFVVLVTCPAAQLLRCLRGTGRVSWRYALGLSLFLILGHVLLDWLQGTERHLWWPLLDSASTLDHRWIPIDPRREAALFGLGLVLFVGAYRIVRGRNVRSEISSAAVPVTTRVVGYSVTALILVVAVATHCLRGAREDDWRTVRTLLERAEYDAALSLADQADRWPSTAKVGRLDYARAEAYAGLGDRNRAETFYLKSLQADPSYFWALVDLSVLYAKGPESLAIRRTRVEPYLKRLRRDHADHESFSRVVEKIKRKLNE